MKYIIVLGEPYLFPASQSHDFFARRMGFDAGSIDSAGTDVRPCLDKDEYGYCGKIICSHGSFTLKIEYNEARHEKDLRILNCFLKDS